MNRFDPETEREIVIALRLPMLNFQPWLQSPTRIARHAHQSVKDLVPCYWVGLADAARPKLQAILGWMEGQLPPHLGVWSPRTEHWHAGRTHHRWWWQSVAVCRWLLHDDRGETDFARAVEVEHEGWTQAPGDALEFEQRDLEMTLPKLLPMALSGGRPALGVALDALCTERDPDWGHDRPWSSVDGPVPTSSTAAIATPISLPAGRTCSNGQSSPTSNTCPASARRHSG